jgi:hypothetical protein
LLSGFVRAEPKIEMHGPIFAIRSYPSTNSDMILKIAQLSFILMSFQSFLILFIIISLKAKSEVPFNQLQLIGAVGCIRRN